MEKICGENKIKEILLLDDMSKKSVLWALTGIKCKERPSRTYLEKEKQLRFERERQKWSLLHYEKVWKENWRGVRYKKEFESDLRGRW